MIIYIIFVVSEPCPRRTSPTWGCERKR